jgi:hypothetical protein
LIFLLRMGGDSVALPRRLSERVFASVDEKEVLLHGGSLDMPRDKVLTVFKWFGDFVVS